MKKLLLAAALLAISATPAAAENIEPAWPTCGQRVWHGADAGVTVVFYDAERGMECRPVQFEYLHLVDRAQADEFTPGQDCIWFEDGSIRCD